MTEDRAGLDRRKLYEMVWKEPVEDVAKRFGLSGRGLAKFCERQGIPVPPRGYWQKKAAGRIQDKRPPLIELPHERFTYLDLRLRTAVDNSARQQTGEKVDKKPEAAFAALYESELAVQRPIKLPAGLRKLHPIVSGWMAEGHMSASLLTKLEPTTVRIFRLSSALLLALEAAGFDLPENNQFRSACRARYRTVELLFSVSEHTRNYRLPITDEERRVHPWDSRKWKNVSEPTGGLMLKLRLAHGAELPAAIPHSWHDDEAANLEVKLPAFMAASIAAVAYAEHCNALEEERRQALERMRKLAEDRQREREREAQRRLALRADAKAWHEAMDLRSYVAAVQNEIAAGRPIKLRCPLDEWVNWSLAVADEIDPMNRK